MAWSSRVRMGGGRSRIAIASIVTTVALVGAVLGVITGTIGAPRAGATTVGPPSGCTPSMNPVQCENLQPGTPITNSPMSIPYQSVGDTTIQGFATSISVDVGGTAFFKVNAPGVSAWHINIFRMGYYQGLGAREWASDILPSVTLPQAQPTCQVNPGGGQATGLIDCGNWAVSASWQVPTYAVSGLYVALLTRNDTGGASEVPFVVRNDGSTANIVYQTADATWEAYNAYNPPGVSNPNGTGIDGGNSLYQCYIACPPGHPGGYSTTQATAVSYNRPLQDGGIDSGRDGPFYAEIPMIQFLEQNGYDVTYISEADTDSNASALLGHKIFISSAHDEYWSANMRSHVQAARDAGVSLAFFSGNEVFWKTNYAASPIDGAARRTLVSYKETHNEPPYGTSANQYDPQDPPTWTGSWRDPAGVATGGGFPENQLTGQEFMVNASANNDNIQVPYQYAKLWLWKNTAIAGLTSTSSPVTLGTNLGSLTDDAPGSGTLGYEWDIDADNGFRPAGEIDMSSTTDTKTSSFSLDYGITPTDPADDPATETHHLSLYRAASGALVFGAGTVQWAWGLNNNNPLQNGSGASDKNMQQFTVNLFAAMGVQPTTLLTGLVAAPSPGAVSPPQSTITSPANNATIADGTRTTVSGTATDSSGGVVAGVEVSVDGGQTWHPATTMSAAATSVTWTYTWVTHGSPSTVVESRATDDLGNIEKPTDLTTVTVTCPCSIFGTGFTPATVDNGAANGINVGLQFTTDKFGEITAIRFYKSTKNTATTADPHEGQLWTSTGQLLASGTIAPSSETATGWQTITLTSPVPVVPGTTYVASYYAPNGHTAEDDGVLTPNPTPSGSPSPADASPLHAVRSTFANPNGLYSIAEQATFPTSADDQPGGDNFGVDVSYIPEPAPGAATGVTAVAGNTSASVSWTAPSTGGPVTSYVVTPYVGTTAQTPLTVTGSPAPTSATIIGLTNGTAYTFTVTASNPAGNAPASAPSAAITPSPNAPPLFVQKASNHVPTATAATGLSTQMGSPVTANDRLVVEVGVWSNSGATASSVTDSAGDTFTELTHFTAPDKLEESIWTAPVTNGAGSAVTVTAKPSATADVGLAALEYQGLSTASGLTPLDKVATATGTTSSAGTVQSGATATSSGTNELALGFYADSGFNVSTLKAGSGYTGRATVSPTSDIELLAEDQLLATPATANASATTGANVTWAMSTVVLKSEAQTPPTVPAAPTGVTATAGPGSASLTWTAPGNGGALITNYTVTPFIGTTAQTPITISNSPPATSATIGGLTPGTSYTFKVSATNSVGVGPNSASSNAVVPTSLAPPGAPTNVTATAGNTTASVSWTAPTSNGGSPITSYSIVPSTSGTEGTTTLPAVVISGSPPPTSGTVTGLTNGTTYTFTVAATNTIGTGNASTPSNAVVFATVPAAPTNVTATAGNASATVTWTAASSGGSSVTSYTVVPYLGSTAQTALQVAVGGTASSASVTGLTNGSSYTFTVQATNQVGAGPASGQSNAVTPTSPPAPPGAPTNVVATAGTGSVTVTWAASTTGSPATSYTVTPFAGTTAQTPVTVSGSPPATTANLTGLTNGTTYTFTVTAVNALGSSPASAASNPATPEASAPACPCSIYGNTTPAVVDSGDGSAVNLGVAFTVDQPGYISGVRFYKAATNTGTHVGTLWSAGGTQLAQVTFAGETASGWQQALFASPVAVSPGTTYVVSYLAPVGHYSYTSNGLATGAVAPPLYALANTTTPNGVFTYGSTTALPTSSFGATNYWVDPVFSQTTTIQPGAPTQVTATATVGGVTVTWQPSSAGSAATSYKVTPFVGTTAQTPVTVSGSPPATTANLTGLTNGTTYTFAVTAVNAAGSSPASAASNPATPEASAPTCPCSIFGTATPAVVDSGDGSAVNLGVAFTVDQPGYVNGVRFYKAAANTGTHVGTLWSSTGAQLAQVTFTGETGSGWQQALFATPVAVAPGPTYLVSYLAPSGHYSYTSNGLANGANAAPLYAVANSVTPNGVFGYGSTTTMPTNGFGATNYWLDPVFSPTQLIPPNAPANVLATAGTGTATVSWTAPGSGQSPITSYTVTPFIGSAAQATTTVSGSPPATSATVTGLVNGTTYTFQVSATSAAGTGPQSMASNPATPQASAPACPCSIFGTSTPTIVDAGDASGVNLGVRFTVDRPGHITGLRFYKAAANTGTHVGTLWSDTGAQLAQVTFTGETASGWQQATFTTPVAVTPGVTYIASYFAPVGHYSASGSALATAVNTPPLYTIPDGVESDGVYAYGAATAFPTASFNATNYWVDVVYSTP